jgi:hypothetical protein
MVLYRLGGVVVSALATGPKGHRFKPGRDDGFLRTIKIRRTPSFAYDEERSRGRTARELSRMSQELFPGGITIIVALHTHISAEE